VAARLGVDEVSLRMSIDPMAPYPTLDVLIAVATAYGVDPTWLITGEYNAATHRALEAHPDRAQDAMREMMTAFQQESPAEPSVEPPTLRLLKDA
jgi:transcriptional regulator with XRE-family HTH domain